MEWVFKKTLCSKKTKTKQKIKKHLVKPWHNSPKMNISFTSYYSLCRFWVVKFKTFNYFVHASTIASGEGNVKLVNPMAPVHQRTNLTDFEDPLSPLMEPSPGWHLACIIKCPNYRMDCLEMFSAFQTKKDLTWVTSCLFLDQVLIVCLKCNFDHEKLICSRHIYAA